MSDGANRMNEEPNQIVTNAIYDGDVEALDRAILDHDIDVLMVADVDLWNFLHIATVSVSLPIQVARCSVTDQGPRNMRRVIMWVDRELLKCPSDLTI